jgi:hypothetical protein
MAHRFVDGGGIALFDKLARCFAILVFDNQNIVGPDHVLDENQTQSVEYIGIMGHQLGLLAAGFLDHVIDEFTPIVEADSPYFAFGYL